MSTSDYLYSSYLIDVDVEPWVLAECLQSLERALGVQRGR